MFWKVTKTYLSVMFLPAYAAGLKPATYTKIYRSRRWAKWVAFWAALPVPGSRVMCHVTIEPFWPDSNVVPLRKSA